MNRTKTDRQLPDANAEEATSTVVLSTSGNYYVDIRILLPPDLIDASVLPNVPPVLDLSYLDWAFAGTSSSTVRTRRLSSNSTKSSSSSSLKPLTPTEEKGKKDTGNAHTRSASGGKLVVIRQCTWTHWVDSRGPVSKQTHSDSRAASGAQSPASPVTPSDWTDTGNIYPTDKENEFLEKGRMMNDKGVMQDMEELWRDFTPQRLPGEANAASIVLKAENKILGVRGMVIRVGGWCQGIIRSSNGEIGVERWRFGSSGFIDGMVKRYDDSATQQQAGKWQKIFKLGKMSLPCESACLKSDELGEGDSIMHGGLNWTVVESQRLV